MFSKWARIGGAILGGSGALAVGILCFSPQTAGASSDKTRILVIGGGTAGTTVAAQLLREKAASDFEVTIVEPSKTHYYQPGWTLVGGGLAKAEDMARPMKDVLPQGATWINKAVAEFNPDTNEVVLAEDGKKLSYDYLVVAPGLTIFWNKIAGLEDALADPKSNVSSIYSERTAKQAWENIQGLKKGMTAVFTQPPGVVKCAGAPQKIMWLAESKLRNEGMRDDVKVVFATGLAGMFGVKKYSDALNKLREQRGVEGLFQHELVEVDHQQKKAFFKRSDGSKVVQPYDFLHVVPPMGAPAFVSKSPLANPAGFVDVDKNTLQHVKYHNVFSLGDAASLPTSKTAAAVSAQAPVLVHNLVHHIEKRKKDPEAPHDAKSLPAKYDGYTSCPLITGYDSLMLAEFKYDGVPKETFNRLFGFDQSKPTKFFFHLKKDVFPPVYWNLYTKGVWYGPDSFFKPSFKSN